ncbi:MULTISPECIES: CAP domain-containing protein [Paenibacillus]|uniref:CAP domain-containing protein n=1 Tax=Paenibacillus TaxID=44249 RepID=UPI000CF9FDED|nr:MULTISPECIES: CAP domain-containing protein [Paenibacillus]MBJ9988583.1 serine protease [Paenibacillus sp. S28]PQP90392.1 serine protease [Paenibacillus sp. AR247]
MKNKMMKTIAGGAFAAVLAAGLIGSGSASAASATSAPQKQDLGSLQAYLEQLLQNNGGSYNWNFVYELPSNGQVNVPTNGTDKPTTTKPSTPQTSKPSAPQTSKPSTPTTTTPSTPSNNSGSNTADKSGYAAQVIKLVNQERAKAGLGALKENTKLSGMAMDKAKDMYSNNYFDHNSPTYGSPFDMMKKYGISYSYAGENIAKGQKDPADVMNAWMNSEGHRANILNSHYTTIGVAYYNGVWVQEFIAN